MPSIFVSHASDDQKRVEPLVNALRAEGFELWWDQDLLPGDRYMERIGERLNAADCALVCWSRASLQPNRDWVRAEAEMTRDRTIPVLLEELRLPAPFNTTHAFKLFDWNGDRKSDYFQHLIAGIQTRVEECRRSLPAPAAVSPRRALLIGVASHAPESGFCSLGSPLVNVNELGNLLKSEACGFQITALKDPSRQEIERAVDSFFSPRADELLILYYAGSGLCAEDGSLHITGSDSAKDAYKATAISLARLELDFLRSCQAKQVLLILDAAFTGGTETSVRNALQTTFGASRSLTLLAAARGAPEANGSAAPQQASPFTSCIVRALESDEADSNQDGVVTAEELLHYLHLAPGQSSREPLAHHWSFSSSPSLIEVRKRRGVTAADLALTPEQQTFAVARCATSTPSARATSAAARRPTPSSAAKPISTMRSCSRSPGTSRTATIGTRPSCKRSNGNRALGPTSRRWRHGCSRERGAAREPRRWTCPDGGAAPRYDDVPSPALSTSSIVDMSTGFTRW